MIVPFISNVAELYGLDLQLIIAPDTTHDFGQMLVCSNILSNFCIVGFDTGDFAGVGVYITDEDGVILTSHEGGGLPADIGERDPSCFGINFDASLFFYISSASPDTIGRYLLLTDTPLADFKTRVGYSAVRMKVTLDDHILVSWRNDITLDIDVILYHGISGVVLQTWSDLGYDICLDFNGNFAWIRDNVPVVGIILTRVNLNTGAVEETIGPSTDLNAGVDFGITPQSFSGDELRYSYRPATLTKLDNPDENTDVGIPFRAYIRSRAIPPSGKITELGQIQDPLLVAEAKDDTEIQLTIVSDFDKGTQNSTVDLTPSGSEKNVIRKFDGAATADAAALQFELGDALAVASQWSLDMLHVPVHDEGDT